MEMISSWPPEDDDEDDDRASESNKTTGTQEKSEKLDLKSHGFKRPSSVLHGEDSCAGPPKRPLRHAEPAPKRPPRRADCALEGPLRRADRAPEPLASAALARWWRTTGRYSVTMETRDRVTGGGGHNPNILLRRLAQLPEAVAFLQTTVSRLSTAVTVTSAPPAPAQTHAALATCLERLDRLVEAAERVDIAVSMDPDDKEIQWLRHRIRTKLKVKQQQAGFLKELDSGDTERGLRKSLPVSRVAASDLTVAEFRRCYTETSTPVIITGLDGITSVPWTLDHIREVAGPHLVPLRRLVPDSPDWARLEPAETSTVAAFLDTLPAQVARPVHAQRYLFDWSLPLYAPQLAREVTVPEYFRDNYLTGTEPGTLYHDSWPSLFIAPPGLRSELHVDAFGSNFWMALFQGRKRWVFFPREDVPLLYPRYESDQTLDPVFDVTLGDPDLSSHPLLGLTTPTECVLQPGEVLFVPAGCPHYVENLEQSVAISANFVDASNLELVRAELRVNGLLDERATDLLTQLERTHCS